MLPEPAAKPPDGDPDFDWVFRTSLADQRTGKGYWKVEEGTRVAAELWTDSGDLWALIPIFSAVSTAEVAYLEGTRGIAGWRVLTREAARDMSANDLDAWSRAAAQQPGAFPEPTSEP